MYVHNLSAVGEQYLDFQPSDEEPPYAKDGTVFEGDESSLPVDEGDLLVDMNDFVGSVDRESLQVVVKELGADVRRHRSRAADAARQRVDVRARGLGPHRRDVQLLRSGLTVLRTQRGQKENIRSFANDLGHPHRGPARTATRICARCSRGRRGPPARSTHC